MPDLKAYEYAEADYVAGMKYKEIAEKYKVSIDTVKSWKKRCQWKRTQNEKNLHTKTEKNLHTKTGTEKKGAKSHQVEKDTIKEEKNNADFEEIPEVGDLTDKQKLFCFYYIKFFNGTKAYKKAYNATNESAAVGASRLLRNDKIKECIKQLKENKLTRELISEDDIFQKYIDIAFSDITDYIEILPSGMIFLKKDLDDYDGSIITQIKVGKDCRLAGISLADKMRALDWLSNHIVKEDDDQDNLAELLAALKPSPEELGALYEEEEDTEI